MRSKLAGYVVALLEELERVEADHEELTDTDVREAIHLVLNEYFVWGRDSYPFPRSFRMFSEVGDELVRVALRHFLKAALESDELPHLPVGQARLDVLQAATAETHAGRRYDEFLGHRDTPLVRKPLPEEMFLPGEYEE